MPLKTILSFTTLFLKKKINSYLLFMGVEADPENKYKRLKPEVIAMYT